MPGRKIRDEVEARDALDAARASGLPRAEWARRSGFDARSLNAWRINLGRPRRPRSCAGPMRLVELVPDRHVAGTGFVVRCGGLEVDVPAAFDDDALRRLLRVVASC